MIEDCECGHCFCEGDLVEHRLNPDVFGIVIGGSNFGQFVAIRRAVTLELLTFNAVELRRADEREPKPAKEQPDEESNVIDFTKAVADLRRAKPQGAA